MTRYFRNLVLALISTSPNFGVRAEMVSDAFGIYDSEAESERTYWSGLQVGEEGERQVQPETPDVLLLHLGEKSHAAGKGFGMSAVMGYDKFGNPIADRLNARFYLSSQPNALNASTQDGVAFVHFDAGTVAGLYQASIEVENRQTERLIYRVTADVDSIELAFAQDQNDTLDPTLYGQLETHNLADIHGNRLGDGFGLQFMLEDADGRLALIPTTVVGDVGKVRFLTSGLNERQSAQAYLGIQVSDEFDFQLNSVQPRGKTPLLATYREDLGLLEMVWGPVTTSTGAMLIDGSRADFLLEKTDQPLGQHLGLSEPFLTAQSWMETGFAHANLVVDPSNFPLQVTVETSLGPQTYDIELEGVLR